MKNKSIPFLAILIIGGLASLFGSWWWLAVVAAVVCFVARMSAGASFATGTAAATLLWGGYATYLNISNMGLLSGRVALLLGSGVTAVVLMSLTALIGGLVGGFSALTGALLRETISK